MRANVPIRLWTVDGVTVDVMSTPLDLLGLSIPRYPLACATAWASRLPRGRSVQVIAASAFVDTQLGAFAGRGQGDYPPSTKADISRGPGDPVSRHSPISQARTCCRSPSKMLSVILWGNPAGCVVAICA